MSDLHARCLAALLLVGCGGATPVVTPTVAPTGVQVSRAPWSITFANDSVLAYSEAGVLTLDGDTLGTLATDGSLMRGDEVVATLASDGAMTLGGATLAPHIAGSRMIEGDVAVLEIDESDTMHVRAPDGRELTSFVVDGAAPEAHPTALFLTAVYLLEAARDAESDEIDDEETDDESATVDEDDEDQDLWRMPIDGAPSEGPADALVTIVELTDFQCPYCSRGAAAMAAIRARFPDDVRLVVRQRPLPFHDNARPAAEAALEARAQLGDPGFFRMSALLFANQRGLTRSTLEQLAVVAGLDLARFRQALDTSAHDAAISRDMALGDRMGAEGTPTFYVNGELLIGAQPVSSFVHAIERGRVRAQAALDAGAPRDHLYDAMLAHAQSPPPAHVDAPRPAPPAPSDVAHAPAGAHAVDGGASFLTEHAGSGDGAQRVVRARIASWNAQGLLLDGASSPIVLTLDGLESPLRAALVGIQHGEIRRVWLPGPRVLYVEALDVE